MFCYYGGEDGWCKNHPIVFEELDPRYNEKIKYCIFHAPKGHKQISVEEFNKQVFEEIIKAKSFNLTCNLSGTIFEGDISFKRFNKADPLPDIDFHGAIFSGIADFSKVTFAGKTDFGVCHLEYSYFTEATFNQKADFTSTFFYDETDFSGAVFNDRAIFVGTSFESQTVFADVTFAQEAVFERIGFNKGCNLRKLHIKDKVILENIDLTKVSFIDTDLRRIDFIRCAWPKKDGRRVLYDELSVYTKQNGPDFKEDIKNVAILYRQLKQKYKEDHNEYEVSDWHYGEKEMVREGSSLKEFSFYLLNLYRLSSGYGERPVRSIVVLFLLIIVLSISFGLTGIGTVENGDIIKIKTACDLWNVDYLKATLQYATFEPKPDFIPQNWFLKIAAKLLIPLQTAFFVLAVRNRFRR